MNKQDRHPGRDRMMKAIKTGHISFQAHMDVCPTCREQFDMLSRFPVSDRPPTSRPSTEAIERYTAIPLLYHETGTVRQMRGRLIFDSWAERPLAQLRDAGPGLTRRICLEANGIRLEVVAERGRDRWEFVARVYDKNQVSSEYVLRVGRQRMLPKSLGFFHWSSKRAPAVVHLFSRTADIEFKGLSWL